jgi:7-cyano-7-deazaguanine synthase
MTATAVLVSGGLDSAVLTAEIAATGTATWPLYIRTGLGWESEELAILKSFLNAIASPNLKPLVTLEMPATDLYGRHWSTTGNIPDATAADEAFYLPGRNVLLLSKALIWCRMNRVPVLSMGILEANPFPDATPEFFRDFASVVGRATGGSTIIKTPYAGLSKIDVVRRGREFPVQFTLSCMNPRSGRHCGECGKCAERGRAFAAAGVPDPTDYVSNAWQGTRQLPATQQPWR